MDKNKKLLTLKISEQLDLDLERSYAYGNHQADIPFLELVGHPFAVEPTPPLEKIARQRSWPILLYR